MNKEQIQQKLLSFPLAWNELLEREKDKEYFQKLVELVSEEYLRYTVYPEINNVYRALELVSPENVKVVILGQDPYFNPGQAQGLAFSVPDGIRFPPSLLNIFKELKMEYGYPIPTKGNLESWARQGVLLLNTSLTVREGIPNSHASFGWTTFTDHIISYLDKLDHPIVYLLWGNYAKKKKALIHNPTSSVIETAHPSPLSASKGFFGSGCFQECNRILSSRMEKEIEFRIE